MNAARALTRNRVSPLVEIGHLFHDGLQRAANEIHVGSGCSDGIAGVTHGVHDHSIGIVFARVFGRAGTGPRVVE
jgi:hypothetical protein